MWNDRDCFFNSLPPHPEKQDYFYIFLNIKYIQYSLKCIPGKIKSISYSICNVFLLQHLLWNCSCFSLFCFAITIIDRGKIDNWSQRVFSLFTKILFLCLKNLIGNYFSLHNRFGFFQHKDVWNHSSVQIIECFGFCSWSHFLTLTTPTEEHKDMYALMVLMGFWVVYIKAFKCMKGATNILCDLHLPSILF